MELNEADKNALWLGKLLSNFQSLEFGLRAFLTNVEIASGSSFPLSENLYDMNEGDIVPENAFTNYDSLAQLIKKYNSHPKVVSDDLKIDSTLVVVRDAIAHGRVSLETLSSPLRLLKFDEPKNNQVKVKFSIIMTRE
jgi:hypothetical protein